MELLKVLFSLNKTTEPVPLSGQIIISLAEKVDEALSAYWKVEREKATKKVAEEESLLPENVKDLVERLILNNQELLKT